MWRRIFPPIHPDGWRFIAGFAVVTLILFWLAWPLGWIGLAFTIWCAAFFRDPWRVSPQRAGLVLAPADGTVVTIDESAPPAELDMGSAPMRRIGIFLSLLDVHINRSPAAGKVTKLAYRQGKFMNASLDKASAENERMAIRLKTADNDIAVVQIAGLVARRIVCNLIEGQEVAAGQRFGLIRFGSRADLYLPLTAAHFAVMGQRMTGGETVIADLFAREAARPGMVH
jgi:phosphatidylserine decarboxylase